MFVQSIPIWKEAPFVRLLLPFLLGIVVAHNLSGSLFFSLFIFLLSIIFFLNSSFSNLYDKYRLIWLKGIAIQLLFFSLGELIFFLKHYENPVDSNAWKNHEYFALVRLEEPPSEKQKSWKVTASIRYISGSENIRLKKSYIILHFRKESAISKLKFGSLILFRKGLKEIKNTGNPGCFNLKSYCDFQHIYSEVFLEPEDWKLIKFRDVQPVKGWLFSMRQKIISILRLYINGERERGLAEALLIGFREDLDRDLVQSYSHTGVVHIIAISGLHLALIYAMLQWALRWMPDKNYGHWLKPILLISSLWIFSFLCGSSPSVLRSAMMFSFLILGKMGSKSSSVYNSLALSAFFLLCIEPAWLWDPGFQLSFGAVLSIVIYMKPIYQAIHFHNRILDMIWKSISVTLAAQILTTPITIFFFHQYPVYFLPTNLVAVPFSSALLILEIFVCAISWLPSFATMGGWLLSTGILWMNEFVVFMEKLPGSVWEGLSINVAQTILFYISIICISYLIFLKSADFVFPALSSLLAIAFIRAFSFWNSYRQSSIIVYDLPHAQAIEIIHGRKSLCFLDSVAQTNTIWKNNYFKPAHTIYRVASTSEIVEPQDNFITTIGTKRIFVITRPIHRIPTSSRIEVDLVIILKKAARSIRQYHDLIKARIWILDGPIPRSEILRYSKECNHLGLSCHIISDAGAFIVDAR